VQHHTSTQAELPYEIMPGGNGALCDRTLCHGKVRVTGFGRLYNEEEVDWSFRPFQQAADSSKNLLAARALPQVAAALGVKEFLAPKPVFGRDVCSIQKFRTKIFFKDTHTGHSLTLLRGVNADICYLARGETYAISASGCAVGWIYNPAKPERLLVAHMGLKCLIDMNWAHGGSKEHLHGSVVDRMRRSLGCTPAEETRLQAGYAFPIEPMRYRHEWTHPQDGEKNKRLCEHLVGAWGEECLVGWPHAQLRTHGCIDLGFLIRQQFKALGIPGDNIHGVSAPDVCDESGNPLWYDTRGIFGRDARNLILVTLY
jgi:hypothetical protein